MSAFSLFRIDQVARLVRAFEQIARTRMKGMPMTNPALCVQAIGFERQAGEEGEAQGIAGILITPWFMNLVWLPPADAPALGVGTSRARRMGSESFEFIGGQAEGFGPYEACSLFSPVFEFADQASAVETARAVLALLRQPAADAAEPVPARRAFLMGRSAARERA